MYSVLRTGFSYQKKQKINPIRILPKAEAVIFQQTGLNKTNERSLENKLQGPFVQSIDSEE